MPLMRMVLSWIDDGSLQGRSATITAVPCLDDVFQLIDPVVETCIPAEADQALKVDVVPIPGMFLYAPVYSAIAVIQFMSV